MRRTRYHVALVLCAFLFGLGLLPGLSRAQAATPMSPRNDFPPEFCTPTEIADGDMNIGESPEGGALVSPASAPDMDLYVVKVTLPPGTCVSYAGHYLHDGAAIWLIESGRVEFEIRPIVGWPAPDLMLQRKSGSQETVTARMVLEEGDWVSADRAVNYSYRYMDDEDGEDDDNAVITMTVLENRWIVTENQFEPITLFAAGCKGVCRRR
jgi:hypothetical protein